MALSNSDQIVQDVSAIAGAFTGQAVQVDIASATLTVSTQTLTAPGLSANVSGVGKTSVGVQLLWTGASTTQVVRLDGSMDGGTTWVNLSDQLAGDAFSMTEIAELAAVGLQAGIRYRAFQAEYSTYRLRWVSGTATNLTITWGLV